MLRTLSTSAQESSLRLFGQCCTGDYVGNLRLCIYFNSDYARAISFVLRDFGTLVVWYLYSRAKLPGKRMPREDSRVAQANAAVEEELDYSDEVDEAEEEDLYGEMDTSSRLRQPLSYNRSLLELYRNTLTSFWLTQRTRER